jgi:hypothetical protein
MGSAEAMAAKETVGKEGEEREEREEMGKVTSPPLVIRTTERKRSAQMAAKKEVAVQACPQTGWTLASRRSTQ